MTKTREFDAFATTVYGARQRRSLPERWRSWRRVGLPVTAVIVIIIVIAVITDLPTHPSLTAQRNDASGLISEVNTNLKPCVFALQEANTIFRQRLAGTLSAGDRGKVPTLLADDASACAFTSDNVNNLAAIEEPGTGAGRYLAGVVSIALTWTTSDALGALDDMILITHNQHSAQAASDLRGRNVRLATDRRQALKDVRSAARYLKGPLPSLLMPTVNLASV